MKNREQVQGDTFNVSRQIITTSPSWPRRRAKGCRLMPSWPRSTTTTSRERPEGPCAAAARAGAAAHKTLKQRPPRDSGAVWGAGVRPHAMGRGAKRPRPSQRLHDVAGRRRRKAAAWPSARPTSSASTRSRTRSTSTTYTPRSCTCSARRREINSPISRGVTCRLARYRRHGWPSSSPDSNACFAEELQRPSASWRWNGPGRWGCGGALRLGCPSTADPPLLLGSARWPRCWRWQDGGSS